MNCDQVEGEGLVGSYLAGGLDEDESIELEEHVIGCDRCFRELELARAARAGFQEMESGHLRPRVAARSLPRRVALVAGLAVAATLAGLALLSRGAPGSRGDLADLGAIGPADLPPFVEVTLRDGSPDRSGSRFLAGMEGYSQGAYEQASEELAAAVEADSTLLVRRLYLGASLAARGRLEDAVPHLQAASQSPALSEDARWLLAKSLLQLGDIEPARQELEALSRSRGARSAAAAELLARITAPSTPDDAGN